MGHAHRRVGLEQAVPSDLGLGDKRSFRPAIMGTIGMVSTGRHLPSLAAVRVLQHGPNAIDAGVAMAVAGCEIRTVPFWRDSYASLFEPHACPPRLVRAEARVPAETRANLRNVGYRVRPWEAWQHQGGGVGASAINLETGVLPGGAETR